MKLTIGIKALNEERYINHSLASAVDAAKCWDGEVILADSGSTDRTIAIALSFPIKVVQLANFQDASCGAGAQLAFQFAQGEYFYLMDGDMVLNASFFADAFRVLEENPEVAGVCGTVEEMNIDNEEFEIRIAAKKKVKEKFFSYVDRLDGGGLYRSSAIQEAGYFADRNLHAFEEFELGARLQSRGWKLARIGVPAVRHYGHRMGGYRLLVRRIRTGYTGATGEIVKGSFGRPELSFILANLKQVRQCSAVILWWATLVFTAALIRGIGGVASLGALVLLPFLVLSVRRSSLKLGLYSLASWNVSGLGLIQGFFRSRQDPREPLEAVELSRQSR